MKKFVLTLAIFLQVCYTSIIIVQVVTIFVKEGTDNEKDIMLWRFKYIRIDTGNEGSL